MLEKAQPIIENGSYDLEAALSPLLASGLSAVVSVYYFCFCYFSASGDGELLFEIVAPSCAKKSIAGADFDDSVGPFYCRRSGELICVAELAEAA